MEPATPLADPLASVLAKRGRTFDDREAIADLDRRKDWEGLLRYAEARRREDPEESDWGIVAGYAWLRRASYRNAIAALTTVTRRNPENVDGWTLLGEAERLGGQPGRASQTLEYAVSIGRTSAAAFFFLGEAYRDAQRLDRAIGAYREAARLQPRYARAWFELGSAHARFGEIKEAAEAVKALKELDPSLAEALERRIHSLR